MLTDVQTIPFLGTHLVPLRVSRPLCKVERASVVISHTRPSDNYIISNMSSIHTLDIHLKDNSTWLEPPDIYLTYIIVSVSRQTLDTVMIRAVCLALASNRSHRVQVEGAPVVIMIMIIIMIIQTILTIIIQQQQ